MTISSIFQDLKEVGVKLTPMSVAQVHAKTRATVWTGSTATGKEDYHIPAFRFLRGKKKCQTLVNPEYPNHYTLMLSRTFFKCILKGLIIYHFRLK